MFGIDWSWPGPTPKLKFSKYILVSTLNESLKLRAKFTSHEIHQQTLMSVCPHDCPLLFEKIIRKWKTQPPADYLSVLKICVLMSHKVWKLKKQEIRKAYLEKIQERNIDIEDSVRVEEQWDKVEKAMTEVAATVCGVTKGKCRQKETWWWCDEVEKAVETKKQKFKEWKNAEECEKVVKQAEYKALRNEAKRCIARVQAEVMKKQAETLDSKEGRQNIFRIGKQKKKERKDITGTNCLKGDNGELLVSEEQVSDRWREYFEYFEKLLIEENEWNDELSAEYVEGPADMISKEEVRQAIQDLKVRKAAGPSGVTGEMIKTAGEQAVDWLTNICNRIVKEEAIPESWQMSELVPIYKGKGDVLECSSSRGIKLLEHGMKVSERVLIERRLRQAVEIDKMQFGFRPGTGTTHATFIARQLQEI